MKKETLKQLIEKCKFFWVNSDITDENFPKPDKIETKNWKIIRMDKRFTSQEALDEIKKQGCRPANCWELAKFILDYKEEAKNNEYLVAFGQQWVDSDGRHRVPGVYRYSDGVFLFDLGLFGCDWGGDDCLLCFCDSSSDTQTLDNSSLELRLTKVEQFLKDNFNKF